MSSVALAVSWASSLTSLATTAKPLPASPARAASIVAFSASRLVCSAMLVIDLDDAGDLQRGLAELGHRRGGGVGDRHRLGGDPGHLGGVLGDLADRGAHLLRAGRDRLHVGRHLAGRAGDDAALHRRLVGQPGHVLRAGRELSVAEARVVELSPIAADARPACWPWRPPARQPSGRPRPCCARRSSRAGRRRPGRSGRPTTRRSGRTTERVITQPSRASTSTPAAGDDERERDRRGALLGGLLRPRCSA